MGSNLKLIESQANCTKRFQRANILPLEDSIMRFGPIYGSLNTSMHVRNARYFFVIMMLYKQVKGRGKAICGHSDLIYENLTPHMAHMRAYRYIMLRSIDACESSTRVSTMEYMCIVQ